jgi:hypothetical protein
MSYLVYKMDDAALAKLNIKTLKRYLASYNISTHGMLEKQGNRYLTFYISDDYFQSKILNSRLLWK